MPTDGTKNINQLSGISGGSAAFGGQEGREPEG